MSPSQVWLAERFGPVTYCWSENASAPGTLVSNITGSCSAGFPGCDTGNYLVNGGFKATIQRWEPDAPGFIYPYKYYRVIQ